MYFKCGFFEMATSSKVVNQILSSVAAKLHFSVNYTRRLSRDASGICDGEKRQIWLTSKDVNLFVHELTHAIQYTWHGGEFKPFTDNRGYILGARLMSSPKWRNEPVEQEAMYFEVHKKEFIKELYSKNLISKEEADTLKKEFNSYDRRRNLKRSICCILLVGWPWLPEIISSFSPSPPLQETIQIEQSCSAAQFDGGDC